MKFTQLKIGERFRYRNADYTKTGPLQAVEDGTASPRLIMRSAAVEPLAKAGKRVPTGTNPNTRLRQDIDLYHRECKAILQAAAVDAAALDRLEIHYQKLLQTLAAVEST